MADINFTTEDGQQIQAPEWANEVTLKQILNEIQKDSTTSKKQKASLDDVATAISKGNTEDKKADKELIDAIKNLKSKEVLKLAEKKMGVFGGLIGVSASALGLFGTALSGAIFGLKNLGDSLMDVRGGTSLDIEGGLTSDVFRNSMQTLGYSADEVSASFENYSGVIAVMGRNSFLGATRSIQDLTGAGSKLGLTLDEIGSVMMDDLELRKSAGILEFIDGKKQAKQSAELYAQQLKATAILGKSIASISGAADDTITSNASVQLLMQSMPEEAQGFVQSLQRAAGEMASKGLDQGVNNAIQNAMLESVAFNTDAGGELFEALSILDGTAGTDLKATIQKINELSKTDPDKAASMMESFGSDLTASVQGLTAEQLASIRPLIEAQGQLGKQFALSFGQLRQAKNVEAGFNALAVASATLDNTLSKFKNGLKGATNNLIGSFGKPLTGIMNAFTEGTDILDENGEVIGRNAGIFETINTVAENMSMSFQKMMGASEDGTSKFKEIAEVLRKRINPMIESMGETLVDWVDSFDADKFGEYVDNLVFWTGALVETLSWVAGMIGKIFNFVVDTDGTGEYKTDKDGNRVEIEEFDLSGTIVNAFLIAAGASVVKKALGGLFSFGMNSAGSILSSKIGGNLPDGGAAEKAGKGFGKGAKGMAAFGLAAAGVGIALFGISDAMETFQDMSWEEIRKGVAGIALALIPFAVGIGLLALAGTGPQAIGLWSIAGVLAAVGVAAAGIGVAAGGISMLVDSFSNTAEEEAMLLDNQTKNIKELAEIDAGKLQSTAKGIDAMAVSMVAFGNATNDGWFSGPDLDDQAKQLGIFEKFSKLDGTGLMAFNDGIVGLVKSIEKLGTLDTAMIIEKSQALQHLNKTSQKGFGSRLLDTVDNAVNKITGSDSPPSPMSSAASPQVASAMDDAGITANEANNKQENILLAIASNTKHTKDKLETLISQS